MKTKLTLALALGCLIYALGCKSSSPSGRAQEFLNLASKKDYDSMVKLMPQLFQKAGTREQTVASLRNEKDLTMLEAGVKSIEIIKEVATDEMAGVDLGVTLSKVKDEDPDKIYYQFELIKEEGEWKIFSWKRVVPI